MLKSCLKTEASNSKVGQVVMAETHLSSSRVLPSVMLFVWKKYVLFFVYCN